MGRTSSFISAMHVVALETNRMFPQIRFMSIDNSDLMGASSRHEIVDEGLVKGTRYQQRDYLNLSSPALAVFQCGTSSAMQSVLCLPIFSVMIVATVVLVS